MAEALSNAEWLILHAARGADLLYAADHPVAFGLLAKGYLEFLETTERVGQADITHGTYRLTIEGRTALRENTEPAPFWGHEGEG